MKITETSQSMKPDHCPCGRDKPVKACCGRYLDAGATPELASKLVPESAEDLMRSRYTAHVLQNIAYLRDTLWPKYQPGFDALAVAKWAADNRWLGLEILQVEKGGKTDRQGTVLFEARYLGAGQLHTHRELSLFRKKAGRWYYLEALPHG